ncbi:hypothetical protein HF086_008461 [Spodoptera exigua]|uniref:Nose resistant-to-fluoxetine protein N-terminal domain-containing protein n=1 Tax=Spodoptera exigua TaxID=7107 RepID=A0A922SM30_SPOEX|nr:hypothetical protein HF086_008461 [Spodoptera exigua]
MALQVQILILLLSTSFVLGLNGIERKTPAVDSDLYESVIDAAECRRQIRTIRRNSMLMLQFADAGIRMPRGVLIGNSVDMGNYYQCLGIDHQLPDMHIEGKYCSIMVPVNQTLHLPRPQGTTSSQFDPYPLQIDNETMNLIEQYYKTRSELQILSGNFEDFEVDTRLAVCIPKPCTTQQAISSLLFNVSAIGFRYTEHYCRLPNDKPWSPADTAAVTLAMLWVIVGHTFSTETFLANPADSQSWMFSAEALWITAATMTVDTFFTVTGVLLVYTTAAKMNQITFLKNLHWFYLSRYVRVTPLLAAIVLIQASFLNQFYDGPHWTTVITHTQRCRNNWWSTLLHVQNFVHTRNMCIAHSWYMAIDFQLYILSPLVLIWPVLRNDGLFSGILLQYSGTSFSFLRGDGLWLRSTPLSQEQVTNTMGPINWFLSLDEWRLPARLSYAMYLFHYPLMFTLNNTAVAPFYFSVGNLVFKFLSYTVLSAFVSFFFILLIDSPVTVLFKLLMDSVKEDKDENVNIENNGTSKANEGLEKAGPDVITVEINGDNGARIRKNVPTDS